LYFLRSGSPQGTFDLVQTLAPDGTTIARGRAGGEDFLTLSNLTPAAQAACIGGEPWVGTRFSALFASGAVPRKLGRLAGEARAAPTILLPVLLGGQVTALVLLWRPETPGPKLLATLSCLSGYLAIALRLESLTASLEGGGTATGERVRGRRSARAALTAANRRLRALQRAALALNADLDPERVRATIAALALTLFQADAAALLQRQEPQGDYAVAAQRGLAVSIATKVRLPGAEAQAVSDAGPGAMRTWTADESAPSWVRRLLSAGRARSMALLPLQHGGKVVGALALLSRTELAEAWMARADTAASFSALAAEALRNALDHRETEYGAAESTFLLQISQLLSSTFDMGNIAQRVAGEASVLMASEVCALYHYDPLADELELRALQKGTPERAAGPSFQRLPMAELPMAAQAAREGRPLTAQWPAEGDLLSKLGAVYNLHAGLTIPLRVRDSIQGFLFQGRNQRPYSDAEVQLGFKFGALAALALDNARLYADLADQMQQLRGAQAQLVEAEKMASLGRIVAGVAHELNNPLAVISGYAQMLLVSDVPPTLRGDLERIDRGARRAAQVVRDLLAFARQQPIIARSLDLGALVQEVLSAEEPLLRQAGIKVEAHVQEGLPRVRGDRSQLNNVLTQLIVNARQAIATRPGAGHITIGATFRERIVLTVSDDGPGIPEDLLDKVFEPFLTTQEVGQGAGLGLSMCYGVVRAHGGRIWVTNNPAHGATFHVELPPAPVE